MSFIPRCRNALQFAAQLTLLHIGIRAGGVIVIVVVAVAIVSVALHNVHMFLSQAAHGRVSVVVLALDADHSAVVLSSFALLNLAQQRLQPLLYLLQDVIPSAAPPLQLPHRLMVGRDPLLQRC